MTGSTSQRLIGKRDSANCSRSLAIATGSSLPILPIRRNQSPASRLLSPARINFDVVRHVLDAITSSPMSAPTSIGQGACFCLRKSTRRASTDYRRDLAAALHGAHVQYVPHEQIIAKLDQSAQSLPNFADQDGYDHPLHFCLLRTRLRLLERRSGTEASRRNIGVGARDRTVQPSKGSYCNGIEQARFA